MLYKHNKSKNTLHACIIVTYHAENYKIWTLLINFDLKNYLIIQK